jgi:hypothetical protein
LFSYGMILLTFVVGFLRIYILLLSQPSSSFFLSIHLLASSILLVFLQTLVPEPRALGLKAGGFLGRSRLRLRKPRTRLPNGRPLVCPGNSDSFRFPSTLLLGVVRIPHGLKKAFSWFLAWFACLLLAYSTFQPLLLLVVF